jgi:hypothetical protein
MSYLESAHKITGQGLCFSEKKTDQFSPVGDHREEKL